MRWGFPNYPSMVAKVKATAGIDITVEDVQLLPWGENNRLDRGAYQKLQAKKALSSRSIRDDVKKKERDTAARRKREQEMDEEFEKLKRAAAEDEQRRQQELDQHEREKAAKARRKKEAEERKKEKERKQEAARRQKEEMEERKREAEERLRLEAESRMRKEEEDREMAKLLEKERELRAAEEKKQQDELKRKVKKEKERLKREALEKEKKAEERKKAAKAAKKRLQKHSREPPPPTQGQSPVERAYRCFLVLAKPNKRTLKACLDRCDGLLLVEGDIDTLPWNKQRADLDYSKLRKLLAREETRRTIYGLAKQLWEKEGRPEKDELKDKIEKLSGGAIRPEDLDALIWDKHECVLVEPDEDNMEAVRHVEKQIARRKVEEEERQKLYSEYELKIRSNRPPPVTTGNEPVERAYRWYQRLNGVKKRTLYNVILETPGIDISKADVNLLPWVGKGPRLDFQKLSAMLEEIEERRRKKLLNRNTTDDEPARRKQALDWYTTLKNPTKETMYRLVDETIGMKMSKADVDLLPWKEGGREVDETSPLLPRRRKSYKL